MSVNSSPSSSFVERTKRSSGGGVEDAWRKILVELQAQEGHSSSSDDVAQEGAGSSSDVECDIARPPIFSKPLRVGDKFSSPQHLRRAAARPPSCGSHTFDLVTKTHADQHLMILHCSPRVKSEHSIKLSCPYVVFARRGDDGYWVVAEQSRINHDHSGMHENPNKIRLRPPRTDNEVATKTSPNPSPIPNENEISSINPSSAYNPGSAFSTFKLRKRESTTAVDEERYKKRARSLPPLTTRQNSLHSPWMTHPTTPGRSPWTTRQSTTPSSSTVGSRPTAHSATPVFTPPPHEFEGSLVELFRTLAPTLVPLAFQLTAKAGINSVEALVAFLAMSRATQHDLLAISGAKVVQKLVFSSKLDDFMRRLAGKKDEK